MSESFILGLVNLGVTLTSAIIAAVVTYKLGVLHKQINSRMDELLTIQKALGKSEGKAEGRAEKKEEMKKDIG